MISCEATLRAICIIAGHALCGTAAMKPWTDRSGRFSPLKTAILVAALVPALWIGSSFAAGRLGPLPFDAAISETGKWTIRFLLLSLLITPLQRVGNWPRLIIVRRMIGIAALAYGLFHLCLSGDRHLRQEKVYFL